MNREVQWKKKLKQVLSKISFVHYFHFYLLYKKLQGMVLQLSKLEVEILTRRCKTVEYWMMNLMNFDYYFFARSYIL